MQPNVIALKAKHRAILIPLASGPGSGGGLRRPPTPPPFFVPIFENKEVDEVLAILAPEIFGSKALARKILSRRRLGEACFESDEANSLY